MKIKQRQRAIKLRKGGFSVKEISINLHISQSTASAWVKGVVLSDMAQKRLQNRRIYGRIKAVNTNRKKRECVIGEIQTHAHNTISGLKINSDLARLACALLYWCEGEKNCSAIRFMNSDPAMIETFLDLLRQGFKLDEKKFRVCLHLHPYHNEIKQIHFWSEVTGIQKSQFLKVFKKQNSGITIKKDYPGCASVRYHDYKVANELKFIWELFQKNIGASYNGSTGLSKSSSVGSIPTAPATQQTPLDQEVFVLIFNFLFQ